MPINKPSSDVGLAIRRPTEKEHAMPGVPNNELLSKTDELVGKDSKGNHYYQNNSYYMGRSRWVYNSEKNIRWDYDAGQVPADWHGWLHYKTDEPPNKADVKAEHKEYKTGQSNMYYPYSTNFK